MNDKNKVLHMGPQPRVPQPIQQQLQIQIDTAKDKPKACVCGCTYFQPAIMLYPISAVHPQNPTGQEIVAQQGVLVCLGCRTALK